VIYGKLWVGCGNCVRKFVCWPTLSGFQQLAIPYDLIVFEVGVGLVSLSTSFAFLVKYLKGVNTCKVKGFSDGCG
jgi:hypothetical protein